MAAKSPRKPDPISMRSISTPEGVCAQLACKNEAETEVLTKLPRLSHLDKLTEHLVLKQEPDVPERDSEWMKEHETEMSFDAPCRDLYDFRLIHIEERSYYAPGMILNAQNVLMSAVLNWKLAKSMLRRGTKERLQAQRAMKHIRRNPYVIEFCFSDDGNYGPMEERPGFFSDLHYLRAELGHPERNTYTGFYPEAGNYFTNLYATVQTMNAFGDFRTRVTEFVNKITSCFTGFLSLASDLFIKIFDTIKQKFVELTTSVFDVSKIDPKASEKTIDRIVKAFIVLIALLFIGISCIIAGVTVQKIMETYFRRDEFEAQGMNDPNAVVSVFTGSVMGLSERSRDRIAKLSRTMTTIMSGSIAASNMFVATMALLPSTIKSAFIERFGTEEQIAKQRFSVWHMKSRALLSLSTTQSVITTEYYSDKVKECIGEATELMSVMRHHECSVMFSTTYARLQSQLAILQAKEYSNATRQVPFSVHFAAEPGAGKTLFAPRFVMELSGLTPDAIYAVPLSSQYWDGFFGHKAILIDEAFIGSDDRVEEQALMYMQLVSSQEYRPNLASVNDFNVGVKGMKAEPDIVMTMNNTPWDRPPGRLSPDALQRRRNHVVYLEVKRKYKKAGKSNIDLSKLTPEQLANFDWLNFRICDAQYTTGITVNHFPPVDYPTFMQVMKASYEKHKETHSRLANVIHQAETFEKDPEVIVNEALAKVFAIPTKPKSLLECLTDAIPYLAEGPDFVGHGVARLKKGKLHIHDGKGGWTPAPIGHRFPTFKGGEFVVVSETEVQTLPIIYPGLNREGLPLKPGEEQPTGIDLDLGRPVGLEETKEEEPVRFGSFDVGDCIEEINLSDDVRPTPAGYESDDSYTSAKSMSAIEEKISEILKGTIRLREGIDDIFKSAFRDLEKAFNRAMDDMNHGVEKMKAWSSFKTMVVSMTLGSDDPFNTPWWRDPERECLPDPCLPEVVIDSPEAFAKSCSDRLCARMLFDAQSLVWMACYGGDKQSFWRKWFAWNAVAIGVTVVVSQLAINLRSALTDEKPQELSYLPDSPKKGKGGGKSRTRKSIAYSKRSGKAPQVAANYRRFSVTLTELKGSKEHVMIPIRGRVFLTYAHGMYFEDRMIEQGEPCTVNFAGGSVSTRIVQFACVEESDLMFLEFDNHVPECRNTTDSFAYMSELEGVDNIKSVVDMGTQQHWTTASLDEECWYKFNAGGFYKKQIIHDCWTYNALTKGGDCGNPLIAAEGPLRGKVIGIHVAGSIDKFSSPRGVATMVTRDVVEEVLQGLQEHAVEPALAPEGSSYSLYEKVKAEPLGKNVEFISQVPRGERVYLPDKTKIRRSCLHGEIGSTPTKAPAVLSIRDPRAEGRDPVFLAVKELCDVDHPPLDGKILEESTEAEIALLSKMKFPVGKRLLTLEEAIGGIPGIYAGIDPSTSSGLPLCLMTKKKGKTDFFWYDKDGELVIDDEFRRMCDEHFEKVKSHKGEMQCNRVLGYTKDELRSHSKNKDAKVRLTYCNNLLDLVVFRRFYGFLMCAVNNDFDSTGIAIGINQYSHDMQRVRNYLGKVRSSKLDCYCAGDLSAFDKHFHPQVREASYNVVWGLVEGHVPRNVHDYFVVHETKAMMQIADLLLRVKGSNWSGGLLTAFINSIQCRLYFRYIFIFDQMGLRFDEHVRMIVLGDDHVLKLSDSVTWTPVKIKELMKLLGQNYTAAVKDEELTEDMDIFEDVTFLGASPVMVNGEYSGAASIGMLNTVPQFTRDQNDKLDQVVVACIEMASQHSKSFFADYVSRLRQAYMRLDRRFPAVGSYQELRRLVAERTAESGLTFTSFEAEGPRSRVNFEQDNIGGMSYITVSNPNELGAQKTFFVNGRNITVFLRPEDRLRVHVGMYGENATSYAVPDDSDYVPCPIIQVEDKKCVRLLHSSQGVFDYYTFFNKTKIVRKKHFCSQGRDFYVTLFPDEVLGVKLAVEDLNLVPEGSSCSRASSVESDSSVSSYSTDFSSVLEQAPSLESPLWVANAASGWVMTPQSFQRGSLDPVLEANFETDEKCPCELCELNSHTVSACATCRWEHCSHPDHPCIPHAQFVAEGASYSSNTTKYNIQHVAGNIPIQTTSDSSAKAKGKASLPMDNPPMIGGTVPIYNQLPSMAKVVGVAPGHALQLHPEAMHREHMVHFDPNESSVAHVLSRPGLLYNVNNPVMFTWDTGNTAGTDLITIPINSICRDLPGIATEVGSSPKVPPNIGMLQQFLFWKADPVFSIMVARTPFHSGRLLATTAYGAPTIAAGEEDLFYNQVLEFNDKNCWEEVIVKYNAPTTYLRTAAGPQSRAYPIDFSLGLLTISVNTALRVTSAIASTSVNCYVFVKFLNPEVYGMAPLPGAQTGAPCGLCLTQAPGVAEEKEEFVAEGPMENEGQVQSVRGLTTIASANIHEHTYDVDRLMDLSERSLNETPADINFGLQSFVKRDTVSWAYAAGAGTILASYDVPSDFFGGSFGQPGIQMMNWLNYIYTDASAEILLQVNGQPNMAGALIAWFAPLVWGSAASVPLQNLTSLNHFFMMPFENATKSMVIPFSFLRNVMNTYQLELGLENLGQFNISVFSPLNSTDATSINITVYTRFNGKFRIPKPLALEGRTRLVHPTLGEESEWVAEGAETLPGSGSFIPSADVEGSSENVISVATTASTLPNNNPPPCTLNIGNKFEYLVQDFVEPLRRFTPDNITVRSEQLVQNTSHSHRNTTDNEFVFTWGASYKSMISDQFRVYAGHVKHRVYAIANSVDGVSQSAPAWPRVAYITSGTVPANIGTDFSTTGPLLTSHAFQQIGGTGSSLQNDGNLANYYPFQRSYLPMEMMAPLNNNTWYLDTSVPLNTHYNMLGNDRAFFDGQNYNAENGYFAMLLHRSLGFELMTAVGDDYRMNMYYPNQQWYLAPMYKAGGATPTNGVAGQWLVGGRRYYVPGGL